MTTKNNKKTNNYKELDYRRKWLYQLQSEFRVICNWYKVQLEVPAFRISDSSSVLGSWDPSTRTITISAKLIGEYSWDSVISILKHEMAHQYVHEGMGSGMEKPHGPSFFNACELLGVPYPFNAATGDSPKVFTDMSQPDSDPEYNSRVNKVRKMLSLASSANRHEAAAAMSKANKFIRKYNLERLERLEPSEYSYVIKNSGKKRMNFMQHKVASLLMDYFYVDVVYSEEFDAKTTEFHKTIELFGSRENVTFASHVYDFLIQRVDCLWKNYRKESGCAGKLRRTFILGLLQGFREKLEKEEKKQSLAGEVQKSINKYKTISALVVAEDPGLTGFIAKRFPRLRKVRYGAPGIFCNDTYSAGKTEGKRITVHKVMQHEDGNLGRLLGR